MKVKFKQGFFAANGVLYLPDDTHELPDTYLDAGMLPSDAIIIEGVAESAPEPDPETMATMIHKGHGRYDVFNMGDLVGDNLKKAEAKKLVDELNEPEELELE
jgi:hypothetical protein|tara:strand:- start:288 stop:596 length:309 start_codon:yes stop_codon:yes gene_type:complete